MNKYLIGQKIKIARRLQGRTQVSVAAETGIDQSRLSKLERGVFYPTPEELALLRESLELRELIPLPKRNLPAPSEIWRIRPPRRSYCSEHPYSSRLRSARKSFGALMEERLQAIRSRDDNDLAQQFLEQAGLDSGLEVLFWATLLGGGAKPCSWALTNTGFRAHRIVDFRSKLNVSDVPQPCLEISLGSCDLLLFPQVELDVRSAYYRLDALVCFRNGETRVWINLEVDGRGHDPVFDAERQQKLGFPFVRLTTEDIVNPEMLRELERRIQATCGRKTAA